MAKGRERDRRLEGQWRRIIRKHTRSGLNIRDFCRKSNLRESAFYFWRRELQRRGEGRGKAEHVSGVALAKPQEQRKRPLERAAFVPVRVTEDARADAGQPARVDPHEYPRGRIEIVLCDGPRVHVAAPVDRQALADVLAVLAALPGTRRGEASLQPATGGEGRPCFAEATEGRPC